MRLPVVVLTLLFTLMHPAAARAQTMFIYIGHVKVVDERTTVAQRNQLQKLMEALYEELKKSPLRVHPDTSEPIPSWYMDKDWAKLAAMGKTHFIIAVPKVQDDGTIHVSWEVGAIGVVDQIRVPVFGGRLSEVFEADIVVQDGDQAGIQNSSPRNKAKDVALQLKMIFPELGPRLVYYVNCIQADPSLSQKVLPAKWSELREWLLIRLLSQLTAFNGLQHVNLSIDPKDEAQAACKDDIAARQAAKTSAEKADFVLYAVTSSLPNERIAVRVRVENRPGQRRLLYDSGQPEITDVDFLGKLGDWMGKYEGNTPWQLSVCGPSKNLLGKPPRVESFADLLAALFQEKLPLRGLTVVNSRLTGGCG